MSVAVDKFKEYLRIKTVQPNPDYESCYPFFQKYALELQLSHQQFLILPNMPIHIFTFLGSDPHLPCIMLNSHMDVVPVSAEHWSHDPFAAVQLQNGDIVARGAQDMKCVGIGYLEAIRILKASNFIPKRTVIVTFVPDEEIGGHDGMEKWVLTDHFKSLNVGFVLDEGLPHPENAFKVYYGERAPWWMKIKTSGKAGHGSQFIEPNATLRLLRVLNNFIKFREAEMLRLELGTNQNGLPLTIGDVTSVNINMISAGVQANVVPDQAEAVVDMRITPTVDLNKLEAKIKSWCDSEDATIEYLQQFGCNRSTSLTKDNQWWMILKRVAEKRNVKLETEIFPAATDSRYIRQAGISALGISPFMNTPVLLHDHNEFLNEKEFLKGIDFYAELLKEYLSQ